MTLDDLIRTARERGLTQMRVHLVGTTSPQWQVSSRFAGSSGYHIYIEDTLEAAMSQALNPPTGPAPFVKPGPAPSASLPAVGLFD